MSVALRGKYEIEISEYERYLKSFKASIRMVDMLG